MNIFSPFLWLAEIFTEADGNGGKASFSRVFGAVVIILSLRQGFYGKVIPAEWMTMFWVLVGYQLLSKALNSLSPAALDLARGMLVKAGAQVAPTPTAPANPPTP